MFYLKTYSTLVIHLDLQNTCLEQNFRIRETQVNFNAVASVKSPLSHAVSSPRALYSRKYQNLMRNTQEDRGTTTFPLCQNSTIVKIKSTYWTDLRKKSVPVEGAVSGVSASICQARVLRQEAASRTRRAPPAPELLLLRNTFLRVGPSGADLFIAGDVMMLCLEAPLPV